MDIETKERLARKGDMGPEASAIRMRAARKVAGMAQKEVAEAAGVKNTVISNAEAGLTLPTRPAMSYYYRAHRIDFNFLVNGDFAQLPGDVQDVLFPALEAATSGWDQKERSGRNQDEPKRAQSEE